MKIEYVDELKEPSKNSDFLSEVVSTIFSICKTDPNFSGKDQLKEIDNELNDLNQKIEKQNSLLSQSKNIKETLEKKTNILKTGIEEQKEQLLETLGSGI